MSALAALQAALTTEHAVVYGYGVVGAHLRGTPRREAKEAYDVHRARRDALAQLVRDRGGEPVAAEPAYALPAPVTDNGSAIALAARLEEGAAGAAYDLVGGVPAADAARALAVAALQDAAVRASRWHRRAGAAASTAFPGRP